LAGQLAPLSLASIATGVVVTYDDPFIVSLNLSRLQSRLDAETDDLMRRTVRRILDEFEATAAKIGMGTSDSGKADQF
jgi:hypothetical protein